MGGARLPAAQQHYGAAGVNEVLAASKLDPLLKPCLHVIGPTLRADRLRVKVGMNPSVQMTLSRKKHIITSGLSYDIPHSIKDFTIKL